MEKKNYEKNPFQTDLKNFSPYLEKILQVLMRLKVLAKGCLNHYYIHSHHNLFRMIQKSFEIRLYLHLKMAWKCPQFLVFVFFDHLQPWWSGYWEKQWLRIGHLIEVVKLNHWIHRRHNHNYCEILWKDQNCDNFTVDKIHKKSLAKLNWPK